MGTIVQRTFIEISFRICIEKSQDVLILVTFKQRYLKIALMKIGMNGWRILSLRQNQSLVELVLLSLSSATCSYENRYERIGAFVASTVSIIGWVRATVFVVGDLVVVAENDFVFPRILASSIVLHNSFKSFGLKSNCTRSLDGVVDRNCLDVVLLFFVFSTHIPSVFARFNRCTDNGISYSFIGFINSSLDSIRCDGM